MDWGRRRVPDNPPPPLPVPPLPLRGGGWLAEVARVQRLILKDTGGASPPPLQTTPSSHHLRIAAPPPGFRITPVSMKRSPPFCSYFFGKRLTRAFSALVRGHWTLECKKNSRQPTRPPTLRKSERVPNHRTQSAGGIENSDAIIGNRIGSETLWAKFSANVLRNKTAKNGTKVMVIYIITAHRDSDAGSRAINSRAHHSNIYI